MNTQVKKTKGASTNPVCLMERVELIRTLADIVRSVPYANIKKTASEKLIEQLQSL
jgi:hypothetical protein